MTLFVSFYYVTCLFIYSIVIQLFLLLQLFLLQDSVNGYTQAKSRELWLPWCSDEMKSFLGKHTFPRRECEVPIFPFTFAASFSWFYFKPRSIFISCSENALRKVSACAHAHINTYPCPWMCGFGDQRMMSCALLHNLPLFCLLR